MTWNVLENDIGPGNLLQCLGKSCNLLGSGVDGSFWLRRDMFLQMKIAIIVAIRYVS